MLKDEGISGYKMEDERGGLKQALDTVCTCKGVLVIYSISRLSRNTKGCITLMEKLNEANVDVVSLSESIDTSSAGGKMVFRMMAAMAEFERDVIIERT